MNYREMRRHAFVIAGLLLAFALALVPLGQAQEPPKAPTCEERLAATRAYADIVRQVRDQYEQHMAELAAKVQALERAAAPAAKPAAPK